jgi:hypothetical protein
MTVTSRYPLEDTAPMDLFEPSDSEQAITTATAVLKNIARRQRVLRATRARS